MNLNKLLKWKQINHGILRTLFRSSSNFKRQPLVAKIDQLAEIKRSRFQGRSDMTGLEWSQLREFLIHNFKHINRNNVDAVIVGVCNESQQLQLAKSYIKHLRENGNEPNDATFGKLLRIYNSVYHARGGNEKSLTAEEQHEILEIYKNIRSKHEVLDSISCENLIYGLVTTNNWKEGLELMEMMKITASPTLPAYTEMAIKAFRTKDIVLGWTLLEQMVELRKQPKCEIFLEYINAVSADVKTVTAELDRLFVFLQTHYLVITEKVAKAIVELSLNHSHILSAKLTNLQRFGKCSSCSLHLENVSLCDSDFYKLQNAFLDKVLIRNDVFQKSTPEEVKNFCEYVDKTGPYDCVIDGLNVAYSMGSKKPPQVYANLLASVVKYFNNKNKHVLVLGRKHMNNWPKKTMQYVKDNAAMFLANDLSHDDPFLLYATLKSGQRTDFFSRDFMRQHAFLLGPDLKGIFRRWQQEHQYSLITQTNSGKIIVKEPIRHLICAHKVKDRWHVPYKQQYEQHVSDSFEVPDCWMCIQLLQKK
ncbi:mitochondrial ribonuclease P catalytic subunit [Stomoxys calcitrans]|uniref:mitochondrial ribonuclease P catalytic subunit n=1 Tax=Stomoxys calcitrans TaxID=35570 RepID=UPI0027E2BC33|nr:mitochondrial ribonuclease P catalytic subunit [Stomoxys calcitrans]